MANEIDDKARRIVTSVIYTSYLIAKSKELENVQIVFSNHKYQPLISLMIPDTRIQPKHCEYTISLDKDDLEILEDASKVAEKFVKLYSNFTEETFHNATISLSFERATISFYRWDSMVLQQKKIQEQSVISFHHCQMIKDKLLDKQQEEEKS